MSRWCLLLLLLIPAVVFAHRFAPSSLRIEELPSGDFSVRWKTPVQQVSNVPLEPQLPKHCVLLDESPFLLEGSGQLKQSTHRCEGGLVGRPIAVTGLAANQASALLTLILQERHQSSGGTHRRAGELCCSRGGRPFIGRWSLHGTRRRAYLGWPGPSAICDGPIAVSQWWKTARCYHYCLYWRAQRHAGAGNVGRTELPRGRG